jgi:site-specific DNA-methyltransferase (adenine-specific)
VSVSIITGDAVESMRALGDDTVDVVLTDPPFSSGTRREGAKGLRKSMTRTADDEDWFASDSLTVAGFQHLMRVCALEWRRVLVPGGHALVFIDWRMAPHLAPAIESADLRQSGELIWDKDAFGMGSCFRNQHEKILHFTKGVGRAPQRRDVGNVLRCPPVRRGHHPTEKPVALLRRLLSVVAAPGAHVLDSFAGSGAVGVSAIFERLSATLIEREPHYAAIARTWCDEAERQGALTFGDTNGVTGVTGSIELLDSAGADVQAERARPTGDPCR